MRETTADRTVHGHFTDREAKVWAAARRPAPREQHVAVLVVSPREGDRTSLCKILTRPDFHVLAAESVHDAQTFLQRTRVPVIIANRRLRDGCWKDLALAIRRRSRRPFPRLIVMTSRADDRLWAEVADLGAAGVLSKPLMPDDVIWTVTDCWTDWRREAELCRAHSAATPASATM